MTWDIAIWIWGKKWEPPLNLNVFLLKFPCYLSCIKDIFTIVESWKTKNVTWSFFLLLKLALLSQKMKIQNHTILVHNERFVVPKNQFILCKTVKKISEQRILRKNYGSGGWGRGALNYFWSPITRLIRVVSKSGFLMFCSSSVALSEFSWYKFDSKSKYQFSPFCVSSNDHKQFNQKHSGRKKQLWRCPTDKTFFFMILIIITYVCRHNFLDNTCR